MSSSSSFIRLATFLKSQDHDVVDYWIHESRLRYVRVISCKNGFIYMINVRKYHIQITDHVFHELQKTSHFYLEDIPDIPETLAKLSTKYKNVFRTSSNVLLQYSNNLLENHTHAFRIRNQPSTRLYNSFVFLDIDWFYENSAMIDHEVQSIYREYKSPIEKMVKAVHHMDALSGKEWKDWVIHGEKKVVQLEQKWKRACEFYSRISRSQHDLSKAISHIDMNKMNNYRFQDSVVRSHRRHRLQQSYLRMNELKTELVEKILCLQSNYLHIYNLFLSACIDFVSMVIALQHFIHDCQHNFHPLHI